MRDLQSVKPLQGLWTGTQGDISKTRSGLESDDVWIAVASYDVVVCRNGSGFPKRTKRVAMGVSVDYHGKVPYSKLSPRPETHGSTNQGSGLAAGDTYRSFVSAKLNEGLTNIARERNQNIRKKVTWVRQGYERWPKLCPAGVYICHERKHASGG